MTTPWRSGRRTSAEVMERETEDWRFAVQLGSNSAQFAVETVMLTIPQIELLAPSTYEIQVRCRITGTLAGDQFWVGVRQNNISGTVLGAEIRNIPFSGVGSAPVFTGLTVPIVVPASATGQWVISSRREAGGGNGRFEAGSYVVLRRVGHHEVMRVV